MLRFIIMLLLMPSLALAQTAAATAPTAATTAPTAVSYLSVMTSLVLVIALVLVLAAFYKRMNLGFPGSQAIKVVTALPLGSKERIMVIEVNGQQHLIGVTPQQINHLISLDEPLSNTEVNPGLSFQKILQGARKNHG